ncbi:hypothetical protein DFH07DRAFT_771908 [Mycena maculata]|uniref:Uncharacterized protein n=1 Tax=Mycena maculata TaxID=230809 RepID=A0AAD7JCE7_9AGAR|nr:hypothetical protein DFH07DRAFT_771908 [Mycena maculata]
MVSHSAEVKSGSSGADTSALNTLRILLAACVARQEKSLSSWFFKAALLLDFVAFLAAFPGAAASTSELPWQGCTIRNPNESAHLAVWVPLVESELYNADTSIPGMQSKSRYSGLLRHVDNCSLRSQQEQILRIPENIGKHKIVFKLIQNAESCWEFWKYWFLYMHSLDTLRWEQLVKFWRAPAPTADLYYPRGLRQRQTSRYMTRWARIDDLDRFSYDGTTFNPHPYRFRTHPVRGDSGAGFNPIHILDDASEKHGRTSRIGVGDGQTRDDKWNLEEDEALVAAAKDVLTPTFAKGIGTGTHAWCCKWRGRIAAAWGKTSTVITTMPGAMQNDFCRNFGEDPVVEIIEMDVVGLLVDMKEC